MKLPEDFIHHEGTSRPQCWVRNETDDTASVYHDNYTADDLLRLAKWCEQAARYLQWVRKQEDIRNTSKTR